MINAADLIVDILTLFVVFQILQHITKSEPE
jgi:hypothetical protein